MLSDFVLFKRMATNVYFRKSPTLLNNNLRIIYIKNLLARMNAEMVEIEEKNVEMGQGDAKLQRRFNFFLGFKVDSTEIQSKVKILQEEIINRRPPLNEALINISTLHVTLAVTHLKDDNDIELVKNELNFWKQKNMNVFFNEPIILKFTGCGTFDNAVAFVGIEKCENYEKICNISRDLKSLLKSAGFSTDQKGTFTPHLTVLKLSKSKKLLYKKRNFKEEFKVIRDCKEHFGKQKVYNIQLLSMDDPKSEDGYYNCVHEIDILQNKSDEINHSESCQVISKCHEKEEKDQ